MAAPDATQLFVMVDVETSGPAYCRHSLLEIGAAVGSRAAGLVDSFSALLRPTDREPVQSRRTFAAALERGEAPAAAMRRFADWARPLLARRAKFVARPAAFDWPWIVHYSWAFLGENPFGFRAVCAASWLDAKGKRFDLTLPHVAVEDAKIQLAYFLAEM